jgi:hypothetical protein
MRILNKNFRAAVAEDMQVSYYVDSAYRHTRLPRLAYIALNTAREYVGATICDLRGKHALVVEEVEPSDVTMGPQVDMWCSCCSYPLEDELLDNNRFNY